MPRLPNFYRIADGRVWDTALACFVNSVPDEETVVPLYDGATPAGVEYLRQTLNFYGLPVGVELLSLEEARASALASLNSAFSAAEAAGKVMSSAGFVIDATERSNRDIEGLITSMEASGTQETTFCAADNSFHTVTLEQLLAMRLEVIAYGQALYTRKWTLRTAIESAQSVEAVQAVEINFDGVSA